MSRVQPSDDDGVALLLVLILVSAAAAFVGGVLTYSQASLRTTVAIRNQTSAAYAADGAIQLAINALRKDAFGGLSGQCLSTSGSWLLSSLFPGANGSTSASALVTCNPDPGNATAGGPTSSNTSPGSALLTLGTGAGGEDGLYINSNAGAINIRGGVFSNSTIAAPKGGLVNTGINPTSTYTIARGACSGSISPTPTCNYSTADTRGSDPGLLSPHGATYDPPTASTANGVIGACVGSTTYQLVTPGRFTSAAALNATTGCSTGIVNFAPGTYYFDFNDAGSHVWNVKNTYVIAGTPTIPLTSTPATTDMPGACIDPSNALATPTTGVEFVFGGDSQITLTHTGSPGGQVTVCASKTLNGPPMAFYGLKTSVSGVNVVNAQSGCVTNVPPATRCAVISTDRSPSTTLTIQGLSYVPRAWVDFNLNNNTNQTFKWGLVARAISLRSTGSANVGDAFVDVPDVATSPIPGTTIMYLNAYVCPAALTCTASDKLRLRAKVQVTGTVPRTVTVLSWSVIR